MANNTDIHLNQLVDPNYADLIIENNSLESYSYATQTTEINYKYSVINLHANLLNKCSIGNISYLSFPKCYTLQSAKALEETGVSRIQRNPNFNLYGEGTLIGIIDTGVDYENPAFRYKDGKTRIVSIWDQTINDNTSPPLGFPYGAEYNSDLINTALDSDTPLKRVPSTDTNGHGTAIAGIIGGTEDITNNFSGVVPNAEFVIVKLKQAKEITRYMFNISNDTECYQETDIMFGIKYVTAVAIQLRRPIAICIALGTNQGSHSGQEPLSSYLSYVSPLSGIGITIAAGNEGNTRRHYYGVNTMGGPYEEFELNVSEKDKMFPMEIWQRSPQRLAIDVISPTGEHLPTVYPDITSCYQHNFIFEPTNIWINNVITESTTGEQLIMVRFENAMSGIWKFRLYNLENSDSTFNVWLPSGPIISKDTYLLNSSPNTTITSPGDALLPITLGAYDPEKGSIYISSGRGYTSTGAIKPDLASPGFNIKGPTLTGTFTAYTGTGVAAGFAAGIVAMILQWGIVNNNLNDINSVEIKELLIRGATRDPDLTYPNNVWGYGEINIYGFFDKLRQ